MANQKIKVNYFYPMTIIEEQKTKLINISSILDGLKDIEVGERILQDGEGNIQLKEISYDKGSNRWKLSFLRNRTEAPFITKLDDNINTAEGLDDDEFVGQECCMIYDKASEIVALQSNRSSISFSGVAQFLVKFSSKSICLFPIVYQDKYCEISDDKEIEYKNLSIGYTDVTKIRELATMNGDSAIEFLAKLTSDMSAINGKIELSVGRTDNFLGKIKLKQLVGFFKKNKSITSSLKVKMLDGDTIRIIDLLNNKASDSIEISVTKDDPKTFKKILNAMDSVFDAALDKTFDKCKKIV